MPLFFYILLNNKLIHYILDHSHKKTLVVNILASWFFMAFAILQAYTIASLLSFHKNPPSDGRMYIFPVLLFLVILLRAFLHYFSEKRWEKFSYEMKNKIRDDLFRYSGEIPYHRARNLDASEAHILYTEAVENLEDFFSGFLSKASVAAFFPLTVLLVIAFFDRFSFLVFLVTMPIIPFFMILIGKWVTSLTHKQWDRLFWMGNYLFDRISGIPVFKTTRTLRTQISALSEVTREYQSATFAVLKIAFLSALTLELLATLSTAIIAVEIGLRLLFGNISFHFALFILIIAPEFYLAFRNLGAQFHSAQNASEAAGRIFSFLAKIKKTGEIAPEHTENNKFFYRIKNGRFAYPEQEIPVFSSLNLAIPRPADGSVIFLTGESGSGKSTLLSLMAGNLYWQAGKDFIQKKGMSYFFLPHSVKMFPATLKENIILGEKWNPEHFARSLENVYLEKRISSFDHKEEVIMDSEIHNLSSGEIQRLAIARIFYASAKDAYFLDEPYAFLDHEMMMDIHRNLVKNFAGNSAIVISTHRLDMARDKDIIIGIKDGSKIFQGTHGSLMKNNPGYRSYFLYNKRLYA